MEPSVKCIVEGESINRRLVMPVLLSLLYREATASRPAPIRARLTAVLPAPADKGEVWLVAPLPVFDGVILPEDPLPPVVVLLAAPVGWLPPDTVVAGELPLDVAVESVVAAP